MYLCASVISLTLEAYLLDALYAIPSRVLGRLQRLDEARHYLEQRVVPLVHFRVDRELLEEAHQCRRAEGGGGLAKEVRREGEVERQMEAVPFG